MAATTLNPPAPATVAPVPASLRRSLAEDGDLDSRIRQTEQRLVLREENLRRRLSLFGSRVKEFAQPKRLLVPALGVGLAGAALWWLWRGKTPAPRRVSSGSGNGNGNGNGNGETPAPARHGELPWVRMVAFIWPLLPEHWRSKVSPATASTVVALGLPLAERLLGGGTKPLLQTMRHVELTRYAGRWYEVARLPMFFESACDGQPTAHYEPRMDGSIGVVNRCPVGKGEVAEVSGIAEPVAGSGGGKLKVSLWPAWLRWLPMAWADYWIVHVDDDYSEALVGSPSRNFCWLLSRRRSLPRERMLALVEIARDQGFAVDKLRFIEAR